jgi:hypothetical protein
MISLLQAQLLSKLQELRSVAIELSGVFLNFVQAKLRPLLFHHAPKSQAA